MSSASMIVGTQNLLMLISKINFQIIDFEVMYISPMRFTPRCCKSKTNCCRNSVAVPTVISGSAAGSRGTRMFAPNSDGPSDLCAYTIRPHRRPISPRRIPAMWWTIVWMLPVEARSAMQRTGCCCPDLKRFPTHWMWCRWRWVWWWFWWVSFGGGFFSLRTMPHRWCRPCPMKHRKRMKSQCQRTRMKWSSPLRFCDCCSLLRVTPYRDLICGDWHQDHHRGPTPIEIQ